MDLVSLLPDLLKPYAPWIILFAAVNTYVLVPSLPIPSDGSSAVYRFAYTVLTKLAGNYANAAPLARS